MIEWRISTQPEEYEAAVAFMEARVDAVIEARGEGRETRSEGQEAQTVCLREPSASEASPIAEVRIYTSGRRKPERVEKRPEQRQNNNELIWLLEHPPLYTAGTSAQATDLLDTARFPVFSSGRGGQFTYHGPGQRVGYVMLDLKSRYTPEVPDLRDYVQKLERWLIATLAEFGVRGELREGRIGVWVATAAGEKKIAALGVRVRRGVSYHGVALNVNPDLTHFSGIVPCGIREYGVTSLWDLGIKVSMEAVDKVLQEKFTQIFA